MHTQTCTMLLPVVFNSLDVYCYVNINSIRNVTKMVMVMVMVMAMTIMNIISELMFIYKNFFKKCRVFAEQYYCSAANCSNNFMFFSQHRRAKLFQSRPVIHVRDV